MRIPHALLAVLVLCVASPLAGCEEATESERAVDPPAEAPAEAPARVVFPSPLTGRWYPADRAELTSALDALLEAAPGGRTEGVRALVLPHAAYRWSGAVAAEGWKTVAGGPFRRVLLLGTCHHVRLHNVVSVPRATHYETPLGTVPLDVETVHALERHAEFQHVSRAHAKEHSVQIQIPFLQRALPEARVVPLVVGDLDAACARRVAEILLAHVDDETLVVASTDFTHYGPRFGYVPFEEDIEKNLRALDLRAYAFVESKDADGFAEYVRSTKATICGRNPVEVLLRMLPDAAKARLVRYDTSGRIGDNWQNSVSYMSIAIQVAWVRREELSVEAPSPLRDEEKAALVMLARQALVYALTGRDAPTPESLGVELTPLLERPAGSFVTLRRDGALRGCIGEIHATRPLWQSVMGVAVSAALHDHRFRSVTADELDSIDLKISVLTPPREVPSWEHIELGRHGIILDKAGRSATYLPQVAPEQGWDLDTTLSRLAQKAGLPADAWHEGARLRVFEAVVFGEEGE